MKGFETTHKKTINPGTDVTSNLSRSTRPFLTKNQDSGPMPVRTDTTNFGSSPSTGQAVIQMGKLYKKKKTSTRDRVFRAHTRSIRRWKGKLGLQNRRFANRSYRYAKRFDRRRRKKKKGVITMKTPLGLVNLSKFPTLDLGAKITTVKSNYGNQTVGHKYDDLIEGLVPKSVDEKDVARDLLRSTRKRKRKPKKLKGIKEDRQFNAGAKLLSISHVSEERRFGGSGKVARGVLRMVKEGKIGMKEGFTGDSPLFPMAKNPDYMRRLINPENKKYRKKIEIPEYFDELKDYMSESSDEESDSEDDN